MMIDFFALALFLVLFALIVVLLPFVENEGERIYASDRLSEAETKKAQQDVLQRYSEEEGAFQRGELTEREWRQRQTFLTYRYIDLTHHLDKLSAPSASEALS